MSTIVEQNNTDVDAVLIAFTEATKEKGASVAEWSATYPALARDFARIATDHFTGEPDEVVDAAQLDRLRLAGRSRLASLRAKMITPLASLLNPTQGRTASSLADLVGLPVAYIAKLERRLFSPESLPQILVERLASAVDRSFEEVSGFLAGSPTLARGAAYRSDSAPTLGAQEDFRLLLKSDDTVSEESKAIYGKE